jgi:predicted nucleic acid-binding protein
MDLTKLPYPRTTHFEQPFGRSLDRSLYVTRDFLKPRYADAADPETKKKERYVDELVRQIENHEITYRRLVISSQTLTEIVISLHRDHSESEAEECLEEVRRSGAFEIVQTPRERFDRAADHFDRVGNKDPNFGEFLDYQVMRDEGVRYVATWDTDFTTFDGIELLPVVRWERS